MTRWQVSVLACVFLLAGCFSMVENGLGKVDGGSGGVSAQSVALDVVTLPGQVVFFTGLFLDYGFETLFTDKGRHKWAIEHGATADFAVTVMDEDGHAVSNAVVKAEFAIDHRAPSVKMAITDESGHCRLVGSTGGSVRFEVCREQFYPSHRSFGFNLFGEGADKVVFGSWQPDKIPVELRLRRIIKPYAVKVPFDSFLKVPVINEWVGYDLERNDFVKTNGNGCVADVEMKLRCDEKCENGNRGLSLEMRFPTPFSGGYFAKKVEYSDFKGVYVADTNQNYVQSFVFQHGTKEDGLKFGADQILVVRSRCRLDEGGLLTEARYFALTDLAYGHGNKQGEAVFRMNTVYNPIPNDTALEDFGEFLKAMEKTEERRRGLK